MSDKRASKVFYKNFQAKALDYLLDCFIRHQDAQKAQKEAGARFPEFRTLSYAQVRYLMRQHKEAKSSNGSGFHSSEPDAEAQAVKVIGMMHSALDEAAFARVLDYGMYLMGKKG